MAHLQLSLAFAVLSTQAVALDCIQPDPRYEIAKGMADTLLLVGSFEYRDDPLPLRTVGSEDRFAVFSGLVYSRQGGVAATDWPTQIVADCEIWGCSAPPDRTDVMVVAMGAADGDLIVQLDACDTTLFAVPSEEALVPILDCLRGGSCAVEE